MPRLRFASVTIAASLFLVGCGAETASQAGFLSSYAGLVPDPDGKSDRLYMNASP